MSDERDYHARVLSLLEAETPFVAVTMVDAIGSAPQIPGARMLVTESGRDWGTVGGGKIETHCIAEAQKLLSSPTGSETCYYEWNLQTDIGMTCGGVVRMYFEVYLQKTWRIAVFGAGHVAQALVPLLSTLRCRLWCIDSRPEWLDKLPTAPNLSIIQAPTPAEFVASLPTDTFIVSMTMGHAHDVPILAQALKVRQSQPDAFPFIGVIGSPSKAGVIRRDLDKMGFTKDLQQAVVCPIGLALGNNEPAEIAVSITAQLLQERDRLLGGKWDKPGYRRAQQRAEQSTAPRASETTQEH